MGTTFVRDLCFQQEIAFKNHQNPMLEPQRPSIKSELQKDNEYLTLCSFQNPSPLPQEKGEKEDDSNIVSVLQQTPSFRFTLPKNFQIYLNVDEKWCRTVQKNPQFSFKFEQVYAQISNNKAADQFWSKKVVKRSAYDNKKIQILFRQHIPMIGIYFFQVELLSFLSNKRCDFTIGIVSNEFAKDKLHSRDSTHQQSYTFKEKQLNLNEKETAHSIQLNLRFKVEVNRQEQQIIFFINDKVERKQKIKQNLQHATLLVPYLQTQHEGMVFSWKTALNRLPTSNLILSTIGEEASSIISF